MADDPNKISSKRVNDRYLSNKVIAFASRRGFVYEMLPAGCTSSISLVHLLKHFCCFDIPAILCSISSTTALNLHGI